MDQPDRFELATELLGPLPVINAFCARLGLAAVLESYLPREDARLRLAPATAVGVVVRNLVIGREPVYALGEWAAPFDPALLGLADDEAGLLNDDRVGRTLARLFDADRASMLTRLVLDAVRVFGVDCSRLHNDSTSIKLTGAYPDADGRPRGGKRTAKVTWGHSKDHRPDLKQLVWILTVTADGAVPITYRVADGNTVDDGTHIETWDHLVALLGRGDFLYVADCKLATRDNMDHIHRNRAGSCPCCPPPATKTWRFGTGSSTTNRPGPRPRVGPAAAGAIPTRSGTPSKRRGRRRRATASCGSAPRPRSTTTPRRARTASPAASPPSTSSTNGWPRRRPG